jgi:hypothetical protein
VFEGLAKNDWSTRAPAAAKASTKEIVAKFNGLDERSKSLLGKNPEMRALLESLGVKLG